jgi:hypothetical protein
VIPGLFDGTEEGFADCTFALERSWSEGGGTVLRGVASHDGIRVSFHAVIARDWALVSFGPDVPITGYRGTVLLRSNGAESDAFLRALAAAYGVSAPGAAMAAETGFTAISLAGDPRSLKAGIVKMKLFFEPAASERSEDTAAAADGDAAAPDDSAALEEMEDDSYAEIYLNVDVAAGRMELLEKDEGYRKPVIRALSDAAAGRDAS